MTRVPQPHFPAALVHSALLASGRCKQDKSSKILQSCTQIAPAAEMLAAEIDRSRFEALAPATQPSMPRLAKVPRSSHTGEFSTEAALKAQHSLPKLRATLQRFHKFSRTFEEAEEHATLQGCCPNGIGYQHSLHTCAPAAESRLCW